MCGLKGDLLECPVLRSRLPSSCIRSLPSEEDGTEITVMMLYVILRQRGEWSLLRRVMCTGSPLSCNGMERIKRAKWECLLRGGPGDCRPQQQTPVPLWCTVRSLWPCCQSHVELDLGLKYPEQGMVLVLLLHPPFFASVGWQMFGVVMERSWLVGTQQHRVLRADPTMVALSKGRNTDN